MLEYALNTTNGQETKNLVPVSTRHPLIISWVFCKQLLNQQIPKNLGHDDEVGRNWEFFSFWYYRQWLMSRKTRYLLCGQFSLVWNNSIRVYLTTESTRFKPVSLFDGLSASIYFTLLFRRFSFYFQTMWIGEYFIFVFIFWLRILIARVPCVELFVRLRCCLYKTMVCLSSVGLALL